MDIRTTRRLDETFKQVDAMREAIRVLLEAQERMEKQLASQERLIGAMIARKPGRPRKDDGNRQ